MPTRVSTHCRSLGVMLSRAPPHGRPGDPDPGLALWENTCEYKKYSDIFLGFISQSKQQYHTPNINTISFILYVVCTLTCFGVPLLVWLGGSGETITWVLGMVGGLPLGRFCRGAGMGAGSGLYLTGSGSPESESFGKVRERMLQGRSSVSNPTRLPGCPTLSISSKATNPLGLWVKPGLAGRLVLVLGGDGLFPRDTDPIWETSGGDTEGVGWGWGWLWRMLLSSSLSSKVLSSSLSKGSSSRSKSARLRLCGWGVLGWVFLGPRLGAGSGVRMALWLSPARTGFNAGGRGSWSSAADRSIPPPPPSMSCDWAKQSLLSASCLAAASSALASAALASANSTPHRTLRLSKEKSYCSRSRSGGDVQRGHRIIEKRKIINNVRITWPYNFSSAGWASMWGHWTYLWVHKQRATVRQAETNRQPDFGWAAEFFINLEGNVIKVADGSCVQTQSDHKLEEETFKV